MTHGKNKKAESERKIPENQLSTGFNYKRPGSRSAFNKKEKFNDPIPTTLSLPTRVSRIVIRNNYNTPPAVGEITKQPSKTVPNMVLSIQEILHRHSKGLNVSGTRVPQYDPPDLPDDIALIDMGRLDLVERDRIRQQLKSELSDITDMIKRHNEKQAELDKLEKDILKKPEGSGGEQPPKGPDDKNKDDTKK